MKIIDITFNVVQIAVTASYCLSHKRGQRQLSTRVVGRIDRLFVNETGRMVNAGDKLAALDIPDLVVTLHNLVSGRSCRGSHGRVDEIGASRRTHKGDAAPISMN